MCIESQEAAGRASKAQYRLTNGSRPRVVETDVETWVQLPSSWPQWYTEEMANPMTVSVTPERAHSVSALIQVEVQRITLGVFCAMFCSIKLAAGRKLKKDKAAELRPLRIVLSIRILRSVWVGRLVFGSALVLAKQLH
jgi:hypothetical protein